MILQVGGGHPPIWLLEEPRAPLDELLPETVCAPILPYIVIPHSMLSRKDVAL